MISIKIIIEYCSLNSNYRSVCVDLLLKLNAHRRRRATVSCFCLIGMTDNLQTAINALSLHDEEPVDLPDSPRGSLPTATDVAKDTRDKEKPEASGGILKQKPLQIEHPVVPPGFAPLFPEMPPIERNMALQYISHSDPTERQARITRVQQSFQPGFEDNVGRAPRISHDINKGKGHVFNFQEQDRPGKRATLASERPPFSEADIIRGKDRDGFLIDNLEASSSSSSLGPTVFRVGTYTGNFSTGANEVVKKSRRRPQRWKRICSQRPTGLFRP
ncbi:hypothetical protein F2Q70_00031465 [Brassica cretica]|uniref:Uncharacterized protein n=1 Tax=Brassica cretica TaxID=69181 RepID=A0A8S9FIK3_BRACR|nr:hypothetical protein F2Q70_00031465 [Brassica cretica]